MKRLLRRILDAIFWEPDVYANGGHRSIIPTTKPSERPVPEPPMSEQAKKRRR